MDPTCDPFCPQFRLLLNCGVMWCNVVGNVFLAYIGNCNTNQVSFECHSLSEYDYMHPFITTIYHFIMAISSIIKLNLVKLL